MQWAIPVKKAGAGRHGISRCIEEIVCACKIYSGDQEKMWNFERV